MTGVTSLRMLARLAALVSTLVCAATTVATAPSAGADPCPDIEVIFARGTNDAPGLGRPGQAFADALSGQIGGRTMTTYGVNYPASYDFLTAAEGRPTPRIASQRWRPPARRRGSSSAAIHRAPRWSTCWPAYRRSATKSARSDRRRHWRAAWSPTSLRWWRSATPQRSSVIR